MPHTPLAYVFSGFKRFDANRDPKANPMGLLDAVALHALTLKLARAAHSGGLFTGALFARLFVVATQFHLAINTFALKLFLKRTKSLIDVVIANHDLHTESLPFQIQMPRAPLVANAGMRGKIDAKKGANLAAEPS